MINQTKWWPVTLTVKEAMDYTGWKKEYIYSLIKSGDLTVFPGISRNRRIPRHQIDELIGLKPNTEPEEEINQFKNL